MIAAATCTVTVYRAVGVSSYGDPVDANTTPVLTGIPCSIIEQSKRVTTYDQPVPRIIRWHAGRVGAGTDIQAGDRIRDDQTATVYLVDSVASPATGNFPHDLRLDLRQTT